MSEQFTDHKLTAIFYADIAGYSRHSARDERGTHRRAMALLDFASETIVDGKGTVLRYAGDAILAEFSSILKMLRVAIDIQTELARRNAAFTMDERVELRIGLNVGEVLQDRGEIYGDGVNLAARLEAAAPAGGICISAAVHDQIRGKIDVVFLDVGLTRLKNIETPVRLYHWAPGVNANATAAYSRTNLALPDIPSIAIVGFENMSNDPEQDYFSDGISDDITTALSKIKNLLIISLDTDETHNQNDIRSLGREHAVHYLLQGSVRKAGNRIRVSVKLTDTANGQHVWAERYDRELEDLFAVQDEIMREVVVALDVKLVAGEQARAWASGTTNLEAWECVRQGAYLGIHRSDPETKLQARQLLEKALQLDPDYAIAWVMLGWIYQQYVDVASLASATENPESSLASMLDCAHRAIAADPDCADAYCLLAMYYLEIKAYDEALEMAQKSVKLAPFNGTILAEAGMVLNKTGQPQRALELNKRAMQVCPMYRPGYLRGLGLSYYLLQQNDAAIRAFEESIARESEYLSAHTNLAAIHGELGNQQAAALAVAEILRLAPDFSISDYVQGLSFRDDPVLRRMEQGLRKAGLPE